MRLTWLSFLGFLIVFAACTSAPASPAPLASPSPSSTPSPTVPPTATLTPTLTPTPTFTPSPTPVPDITWQNPWTGETVRLPASCYSPEMRPVRQALQQHPQKLMERWLAYWPDYYEQHPQLTRVIRKKGWAGASLLDWGWYRWDQKIPVAVLSLGEANAQPFLHIAFVGWTLGLAGRYDFPALGVTVFTACAAFYDPDLTVRPADPAQWPPASDQANQEWAYIPPTRTPEEAQPRWFFGEVPVAYLVWPDAPVFTLPDIHPPPLLEELPPELQAAASSGWNPFGDLSLNPVPTPPPLQFTYAPGCYYPFEPTGVPLEIDWDQNDQVWQLLQQLGGQTQGPTLEEDRQCRKLADILSMYNGYVGVTMVMATNDPEDALWATYANLTPMEGLQFDIRPVTWAQEGDAWVPVAAALWEAHAQKEVADSDRIALAGITYRITRNALGDLLHLWSDAQAGECFGTRALAWYPWADETAACSVEDLPERTLFWPNLVMLLLNDNASVGELPLTKMIEWAQGE